MKVPFELTKCVTCESDMYSIRKTHRFCSTYCRVKWHRQQARESK